MAEHGRDLVPDWSDVWPGLLILGTLLVVSLLTFFTDALRRATTEGPLITLLAPEVGGLERGSDVWLAGTPSGRVLGVEFREPGGPIGERVAIEAVMRWEAMPFLRHDARVTVGSASLLAPAVVKIGPGTRSAEAVADGDTLRVAQRTDIGDFRDMADSVRAAFHGTRDDAARLAEAIRTGTGTTGRYRNAGVPIEPDSLRARIERLRIAWSAGAGLARLTRDDTVHRAANAMVESLRRLQDPEPRSLAVESLDRTAIALGRIGDRSSAIGAALERAEGTAGRAIQDPALGVNTERTRAILDSLTVELARHPFRWLRFRLF